MTAKRKLDWEAIEREYRAGQISVREIAKGHGISDTAIRKAAKAEGWERALAEQVRKAVREKLVRIDSSRDLRANDREVLEGAAARGMEVVQSHRRDIRQLSDIADTLADRLRATLSGDPVEGLCLGKTESAGDLLEKLTRVRARLIPLERQAFNLDEAPEHTASASPVRIELVPLAADDGSAG